MKHNYPNYLVLFLILILCDFGLFAQNQKKLWTKTTQQKATAGKQLKIKSQPHKSDFYQLDLDALKTSLKNAPKRGESSKPSKVLIDFPLANGSFDTFRVIEAPILHPDLQASMPNSRTYIGQSVKNPNSKIRFSITSRGLNTMLQSPKEGIQFIDPTSFGGKNYKVYKKKDLPVLKEGFICNVVDEIPLKETSNSKTQMQRNANDGILRTFRLAIASTIEYSEFHWMEAGLTALDSEADKKNAVMNAMIVTMNRVNGVFENELSITMQFVANNMDAIFIDSDDFDNDNASNLINESQTVIDATIGNGNYDIGHTFSTGGGGLAQLNSPCSSRNKARGITGSSSPVGDSYDIDFVAHEMGHQFGAPHTFNGNSGNCAGNRTASNAYEPGSGSTIMAYAGICSPQNVQPQSDFYFHQKSLQMIWDNISSGISTCGTQTATNNSAPTAEAGSNYTIPISTPYKLTGSSTDVDGISTHTYTWEQYDLGDPGLPTENDASEGPMVRSFEGTGNVTRFIPRLQDLVSSGGSSTWEKLSSINRNINFQLTVRDNDSRGGQTATDNMTVTSTAAAGPFLVTSQNTSGISWTQGSTETITWDVAGTTGNGVNTANVNILLSTDGGLNFDTLLASNVPNDGSQDITVPNLLAGFCRVMVEGNGNIFFAINSANFSIGYTVTESCTEYASTDPNLPIAITDDGSDFTEVSVVNVPASVVVSDIKLTVNLTHPYPGDMLLGLQSPEGTLINILEPYTPCQDEDTNIIATFDDEGVAFNCFVTGDGLTIQSPVASLSSWNEENAFGNWILGMGDFGAADLGTLNSWSITVCSTQLTPLSVNNYEFDNFIVFPNPNKGEFTIKLSTLEAKKIAIKVYDLRGRIIYEKTYNETSNFNEKLNLNTLKSGMYILNVSDGLRKTTKKILVE